MKVHELLSDPSKWTKGVMARSSDGDVVDPGSVLATCFCLLGAIAVCYPGNEGDAKRKLYCGLAKRNLLNSISNFNDTHTHEEVLALARECDV